MEESTNIALRLLLGCIVLGALLQTFRVFPKLLDKEFDNFASKTTLCLIVIVLLFFTLMFSLRLRNAREGFQNDILNEWKTISSEGNLDGVCELYNYMFDKIKSYEKGAPPDELSDAQATKNTMNIFRNAITSNAFLQTSEILFSCKKYQELQDADDVDTFLVKIQLVPDNFLKQAYDLAVACRKLLRDQLVEVEQELKVVDSKTGFKVNKDFKNMIYPLEPFVNPSVGICSAETVEERRKFLREKKLTEKQQQCLLPEEVPLAPKVEIIQTKISKLVNNVGADTIKEIPLILKQANEFRKKLETYKNKAEQGQLESGQPDDSQSPSEPKSGPCSREEYDRKNEERAILGLPALPPFVPCPKEGSSAL